MRRRFSAKEAAQLAVTVIGFGVVVLVIANIFSFATTRGQLPPNTFFGEANVSGMTAEQAVTRAALALRQPVMLRYQGEPIPLQPSDVDFSLNDTVARLQLEQVLRRNASWENLPKYALRQFTTTQVAAPYNYAENKLIAALSGIARERDRAPAPPSPDKSGLIVNPGSEGRLLNIADARDAVLGALASAASRTVDLPVDIAPLTAGGLRPLGEAAQAQLAAFASAGGISGAFIKDLKTGNEYSLNGEVAFSGKGWTMLALALAAYADGRAEATAPQLLRDVVVSGSEQRANELLRLLGNGDALAGAQAANATLKKLGLTSTFIAQPFGSTNKAATIVTPGNSRPDVNTSPDPNAQSTPADVGAMLEMLDQCAKGGGPLPLALPGKFNAQRCNELVGLLSQNKFGGLIEAFSPNATVARRQSWDDLNHGDAALVRSPNRDYIIAVMLNSPNKLDWAATSTLIGNLARTTYGYFNNGAVPPAAPPMTNPPPN